MPARDIYHHKVKNALIKDGWTITHDPLHLQWGKRDLYVDLGAEQLVGAEKDGRKIAIEIKSFIRPSEMEDLETALGQYVLYRTVLPSLEPDRALYLAIREATFHTLFDEPIGQLLLTKEHIPLLVFDPQTELILQWIP